MIDKDMVDSVYNHLTQIYLDTGRPVPMTLLIKDMKIKSNEMAWIIKQLHRDSRIKQSETFQYWLPTNTSGNPFFITLPDGRKVQIGRIQGEFLICDKGDDHITHSMFDEETINMNLEGLYRLRAMGVKYVKFNYSGKRGKITFEVDVSNFISSKYSYDNKGELQKGYPLVLMRKEILEEPRGLWKTVR